MPTETAPPTVSPSALEWIGTLARTVSPSVPDSWDTDSRPARASAGEVETLWPIFDRSGWVKRIPRSSVITDDRGIRLTHPDRSKIGHRVSTSPAEALAGRESVSHESGTLGETVRAKVPIHSSADGETVGGAVSVGITA